uniref:Ubiquitin-like protease family profile domain-containing protein n=2 Tax=Oryza punctata TaxID=4537 RepID=A0A0E0LJ10_ORYPU
MSQSATAQEDTTEGAQPFLATVKAQQVKVMMSNQPLILLDCWKAHPHSLSRPSRFVSPLKIGHTHPLPGSAKVTAFHQHILSAPSQFGSANFIEIGISIATTSDISSSFTDGSMIEGLFIDAFINMRSMKTLLNLDFLNGPHYAPFDAHRLEEHLREVLPPAKELQALKMVIVHVIHHSHCTIYCINWNHRRIDVFDSNNYPALNTDYKDHHGDLGRRIAKQLSDDLYAASRNAFKRFGNQKLVRNKCPVMLKPNDCAFFIMRYMELYDGDDSPLLQVAELEEYNDLRSHMLYYMFSTPITLLCRCHRN